MANELTGTVAQFTELVETLDKSVREVCVKADELDSIRATLLVNFVPGNRFGVTLDAEQKTSDMVFNVLKQLTEKS